MLNQLIERIRKFHRHRPISCAGWQSFEIEEIGPRFVRLRIQYADGAESVDAGIPIVIESGQPMASRPSSTT